MAEGIKRTTVGEVLDLALDLERKTMALYAEIMRCFGDEPELRQFWFGMAKNEAAHCGALMLVGCILRNEPELGLDSRILFDTHTGIRLRSLLTGFRREVRRGVVAERAFEMALDLESSELEDVVVDLLKVVQDPAWRDRAVKMLIHDLGDLSYMIEKHTSNAALLARADGLLERRLGYGHGPAESTPGRGGKPASSRPAATGGGPVGRRGKTARGA